jgi:hypothetical protein
MSPDRGIRGRIHESSPAGQGVEPGDCCATGPEGPPMRAIRAPSLCPCPCAFLVAHGDYSIWRVESRTATVGLLYSSQRGQEACDCRLSGPPSQGDDVETTHSSHA